MKTKENVVLAIGLGVAMLYAHSQLLAREIPALYGTGVLSDNSLAADGSLDLHYSLIATPSGEMGTAFVTIFSGGVGPYVPQGPTSKWITPSQRAADELTGYWTYRTSFNLTDFAPDTASLTASCAADDGLEVLLNGTSITNIVGFGSLQSLTVRTGFVAGVNTLDFRVYNAGARPTSPTGLRVDGLRGTALYLPDPALSIRVSQVELCWTTCTGRVYQVQYQSALTTNQWVNWGVPFPGVDGTICTNDVVSGFQRFYRLVVTP